MIAFVERVAWVATILALTGALLASRGRPRVSPYVERPRAEPGIRLSMDALHQQGGVPLGWQPTLAPGNVAAGREAFESLGCSACHHVAGESFGNSVPDPVGPDLSGMGSHHPRAYFAEAIVNPDAVLIDGPGYVDGSGHSTMPNYDSITIGELQDLVAYLASLTDATTASCHASGAASLAANVALVRPDLGGRPAPPATDAQAYFAQTYEVLPGKLADFEQWFERDGKPGFVASEGVVSLETFVDAARPGTALTTVIGFRDEAALRTFLGDPRIADLWKQFDAFVGPHGHYTTDRPIAYRAPSLSAAAAGPR